MTKMTHASAALIDVFATSPRKNQYTTIAYSTDCTAVGSRKRKHKAKENQPPKASKVAVVDNTVTPIYDV